MIRRAGWALLLVGCGAMTEEIRPLIEAFLKDATGGRISRAYATFSPELAQARDEAGFAADVESIKAVLGEFKELGSVSGFHRQVNNSVSTNKVSLALKFAKGETTGEFTYVKKGEAWKLLAYDVRFPEGLVPKRNTADLEPLARSLIETLNSGDLAALYGRFSPELQKAWPQAKFESDMKNFANVAGKVATAALESTTDESDGTVRLNFAATFEKGQKGTASFRFLWKSVRWDLLGMNVSTP